MKNLLGRMTISEWVSSLVVFAVGIAVPPVLSRGHAPFQVLALAGTGMALGVFALTRKRRLWTLLIPAWQVLVMTSFHVEPRLHELFGASIGLTLAVIISPWCSASIPGAVRELRNRQPAPARNHVAWGDGTQESWKGVFSGLCKPSLKD